MIVEHTLTIGSRVCIVSPRTAFEGQLPTGCAMTDSRKGASTMKFVTDVRFDEQTGELVVTSQDFAVDGNAIVPTQEPDETRVRLDAPALRIEKPVTSHEYGKANSFRINIKNCGLVEIREPVVLLLFREGDVELPIRMKLVPKFSSTFLPGDVRTYELARHEIIDALQTIHPSSESDFCFVVFANDIELYRQSIIGTQLAIQSLQ